MEKQAFPQNIASFMRDDFEHFSKYGITHQMIDEFEALGYEVMGTPDYKLLKKAQQSADSHSKKTAVKKVRAVLKALQFKTDLAYKNGTANVKLIKLGNISTFDFHKVRLIAETWLAFFKTHNEINLSDYGLEQNDLDNLQTALDELAAGIMEHEVSKLSTGYLGAMRAYNKKRLDELHSRYCKIGQQIWKNENSEQFLKYIIYKPKKQ